MWVSNLKNRHAVSLRRTLPSASFVGCADIHVTMVSEDSQTCSPGCLFAAIPGTKADGNQFIQQAIAAGATGLLCERPHPDVTIPQCVVPHVRSAYATLSQALFGRPSERLKTVGVTGTNGKTTTTFLIRSILQAANYQTGLLGTIEYHDGITSEVSSLTTPDAPTFANWLHRMVQQRTTHAVFELSSHALHQGRAAGVGLDVAVITNITQDHLDYHQTFETYRDSKARIFKLCKPQAAVVLNQENPITKALTPTVPEHLETITCAFQPETDLRATIINQTLEATKFLLHIDGDTVPVSTSLIGRHNVENCLAAAAACRYLGVRPAAIARGIEQLTAVPGRLEAIDMGQEYRIFVDYAHTDDALRRCLQTLKPLTQNKLICVFGAGGDRDRTKRPLLAAAAQAADRVIVTSDNPRTENPERIIEDILRGFTSGKTNVRVEPDRERAIQLAMDLAQPGDTLLVAGKGHETYQIIGQTKQAFDDRAKIRANLKRSLMKISA